MGCHRVTVGRARASVWKSEKSAVRKDSVFSSCSRLGFHFRRSDSVWFGVGLNLLGVFSSGAASLYPRRAVCHFSKRLLLFALTSGSANTLRSGLSVKFCQAAKTMFCRNQTARATVARGSALEMEIRRGKFRKSVFLDTSQVNPDCPPVITPVSTLTHTHTTHTRHGVFSVYNFDWSLSLCRLVLAHV